VEAVVAVALVFGSGVVFFDTWQNSIFSFPLRGECYYCCCSTSDGTSTASGKVISRRAVVLGKVDVRVDPPWCYAAASCVDNLGVSSSRKKQPHTGYFAILDADFDARREDFACCDLFDFSIALSTVSVKISLMKRSLRKPKFNVGGPQDKKKREQATELPYLPLTNSQSQKSKRDDAKNQKTYNSRYSLVVTHPTTNLPI
jgi:hypothetical protein